MLLAVLSAVNCIRATPRYLFNDWAIHAFIPPSYLGSHDGHLLDNLFLLHDMNVENIALFVIESSS